MDMIKEIVDNIYTRRCNELFNLLENAITEAIVERGIKIEPVDIDKLNWWDKYRVNLIAAPKVDRVKIDIKKEHS